MVLKLIAFQSIWLFSMLVYLASEQQKLLTNRVDKRVAWGLFCLGFASITVVLSKIYHPLAAITITLVVVMISWIYLTLAIAYFYKRIPVVLVGSFVLALASCF